MYSTRRPVFTGGCFTWNLPEHRQTPARAFSGSTGHLICCSYLHRSTPTFLILTVTEAELPSASVPKSTVEGNSWKLLSATCVLLRETARHLLFTGSSTVRNWDRTHSKIEIRIKEILETSLASAHQRSPPFGWAQSDLGSSGCSPAAAPWCSWAPRSRPHRPIYSGEMDHQLGETGREESALEHGGCFDVQHLRDTQVRRETTALFNRPEVCVATSDSDLSSFPSLPVGALRHKKHQDLRHSKATGVDPGEGQDTPFNCTCQTEAVLGRTVGGLRRTNTQVTRSLNRSSSPESLPLDSQLR